MSSPKRLAGLVAGIIVTLGIGSVAGAGIASADPVDDYIYDLNHAGIGGPRNTLLDLGKGTCGKPRTAAIANVRHNTSLDEGDAAFLYDSALRFLCTG
jgi:hypothetical protein